MSKAIWTSIRGWITNTIPTVSGCEDGFEQNVNPDVEYSPSAADLDYPITRNFKLRHLLHSDTAERLGIDNFKITRSIYDNLEYVVETIAQPARDFLNAPIYVTSGFRCLELNRKLGSKDTSQHIKGEALDLSCHDLIALAEFIRDNCEFDQLILEKYDPDTGRGWVHVSATQDGNRNQVLTIKPNGAIVHGIQY